MFCSHCGKDGIEQVAFCTSCGAVGGLGQSNAFQNQNAYAQQGNVHPIQTSRDSGSGWWGVLGFFVPLVGLILFLVWRDDRPRDSKNAGLGALIGVIVSFVMAIVMTIVFVVIFASAWNEASTGIQPRWLLRGF
ncbi:MAG: zinc ribbon domain-containing protein [Firmicutes bacterium]|nr:zinc ribbon domain-containing protein [Bacillota bacterium]